MFPAVSPATALRPQFNPVKEGKTKTTKLPSACSKLIVMTYLQLRQTAEQVKYSSGKKEYKVILSSASSPQKRSLSA